MANCLMRRYLSIYILVCALIAPHSTAFGDDDFSDRFEFSGFARVVGGLLDEKSAEYEGYSNSLSFSEQSLLALQADVRITDTLSFSTQLLGHTSEERESGIEWMYLVYQPKNDLQFKLGKLRTPFFRYSDIIDVGFAYPWITPPQQIYSGFLFSNYEGLSGIYQFSIGEVNVDIEAYYGIYNGTFDRAGEEVAIDVDEIKGLIIGFSKGNFSARISGIQSSDFFADIPGFNDFADAIEFAGFKENADSLRFDGDATAFQANVNYDTLDYFVAAEYVNIDSDLLSVPQIDAYYFSLGYNFYPFQVHATYSSSETYNNVPENLIPKGVNPQVTQLSFAYDQIIQNLPLYDLDSVSLGLRWDFRYDLSAKVEITFLNGEPDQNSFFSRLDDPNFDRQATLYQFGLEWIF